MGIFRLIAAVGFGAFVARFLPRVGIVASTQEIIAFLSLLMAGLLPAMILTATILRGGGLSAKTVEEYGGALRLQLRFWAVLFAAASVACLGVVGIKIFSTPGALMDIHVFRWNFDQETFLSASIGLMGAGVGAVFQRMLPAYNGLVSLLQLNVKLAKTEAIIHDRSLTDLLEQVVEKETQPVPYKLFQ